MKLRPIRHGLVDSTNERAFAALAAGSALHGDVHVAEGQSGGRGRLGKKWESPRGEGLYLSAVLLPRSAPPPAAWTVAGALAVVDATADLGVAGVGLEWPNDVVVAGAKLAGVLVETRGWDLERPAYVLGIGVNVGQREFPRALRARRAATSLALLGSALELGRVEAALLRRLAERVEQVEHEHHAQLAADYLAASRLAGRTVRATTAEGTLQGNLVELSLTGGALLATADGAHQRIALEFLRELAPL